MSLQSGSAQGSEVDHLHFSSLCTNCFSQFLILNTPALPREAVDARSLQALQARLAGALGNLVYRMVSLPMAEQSEVDNL